jgi:hypothetical protein
MSKRAMGQQRQDDSATTEALRQAVAGLLYPSESDEPFEVFRWDGKGTAREQVAARAGKGKAIVEQTVDEFFKALEGSDDAQRHRNLRETLEGNLKDLKVFRAGEVRVDVYIVGKTRSEALAGVHTVSVET